MNLAPALQNLVNQASDEMAWYLIHCKPRREKKVAAFCTSHKVLHYLPCLASTKEYGARTRTHHNPLFPGYLFIFATEQQRSLLNQNQDTANTLQIVQGSRFLQQLNPIVLALEENNLTEILPGLQAGETVRIKNGRLKGVEAVLLNRPKNQAVAIQLDILNTTAIINLPVSDIELI